MAETRINADQYRVLLAYARGGNAVDIAADLGLPIAVVEYGVKDLAAHDRGRARRLVEAYDRQRAAVVAAKGIPAPTAVVYMSPLDERHPAEPDEACPPLATLDALLAAAEASQVARIRVKAQRIRTQLDELAMMVEAAAEESRAVAEVTAAAAALDAARARLREARGAAVPAPAAPGSAESTTGPAPEPKVVRAWAAANGVECGQIGRVPRPVVEKYLAAMAAAGA